MATLTNFFDHPLEKKISEASAIAEQELRAPVQQPPQACNHASLWLDAYGNWHCENCFPPIFDSEIRQRKNTAENSPSPPQEQEPQFMIYPPAEGFKNFENLVFVDGSEILPAACKCGSLDFWWDLKNDPHCNRCQPAPHKRTVELLTLAEKLRLVRPRA
jgi:hypothetical protein